jgi:hypothetical protein
MAACLTGDTGTTHCLWPTSVTLEDQDPSDSTDTLVVYTILLGHRGRGAPAHVCVDAPSHEVHRDTDTAHPEPGDPSNDTITTDALIYAIHPLMRYHDGTALGRTHMTRC